MDYKFKNIQLLDFVKTICAYKGISIRKLLMLMNKNDNFSIYYPSFYNKLKNNTLKFKEMADIANALGYEIILRETDK